jgi:hypothetical protein
MAAPQIAHGYVVKEQNPADWKQRAEMEDDKQRWGRLPTRQGSKGRPEAWPMEPNYGHLLFCASYHS